MSGVESNRSALNARLVARAGGRRWVRELCGGGSYLSESDHRRYLDYLKKTAAQPNFTQRRDPERLADFTAVFGTNLKLVEAKMLRFMAELK